MKIRAYRQEDINEIAELFYNTVHTVNVADYTDEQLNAWADGNIDMEAWNRSFQEHITLVVTAEKSEVAGGEKDTEQIIGFGDMDST